MAKIKYDVITKSVSRSQKAADLAFNAAQEIFTVEKERLIAKFENDSVSKELVNAKDSPEDAGNTSGTLGGYGNLFSFIGFERGYDPISPLVQALRNWTLIRTRKQALIFKSRIKYNFTSKVPIEEIDNESRMPWEQGLSWIRGIKRGISGAGQYLAKRVSSPPSRSGGGIQTKTSRNRSFIKRDYLFEWIRETIVRLRG